MSNYKEYLDRIRNIKLTFLKEIPKDLSYCEYNIHLLLNKLSEARESYLLLMDKERYTDAVLIAGHILENCATVNYIIQDLKNDTKRTKKYVTKNLIQTIYSFLGILEDKDFDKQIIDAIDDFVSILETSGDCVLKLKDKTNEQVVKEFKEEKSNIKKKQILKDNYYFPIVEDYLRPFKKAVSDYHKSADISSQIAIFYNSYCSIKHSGALVCNVILKDNKYCADNTSFRELSPIIVCMSLEYLKQKTIDILSK